MKMSTVTPETRAIIVLCVAALALAVFIIAELPGIVGLGYTLALSAALVPALPTIFSLLDALVAGAGRGVRWASDRWVQGAGLVDGKEDFLR